MSERTGFSVVLSDDFLTDSGTLLPGYGLEALMGNAAISVLTDRGVSTHIGPGALKGAQGLILMDQVVSEEVLEDSPDLEIVARYGVGTNSVNLDACTRHDVVVTITPEGVARPVASSALALILALAHRLPEKQRLVQEARWSERAGCIGVGLKDRVVGLVGLGRIGREFVRLITPFGCRLLAYDPYASPGDDLGLALSTLEDVMAASDFLVIVCALTPETFHLISERRLALMKSSAYLVNVARGAIVDQRALADALSAGALAGAGLDVFEDEPVPAGEPLLGMGNVIATPHSLCWTDECFDGNGMSATRAVSDICRGILPAHVANPEVLSHDRFAGLQRPLAQ